MRLKGNNRRINSSNFIRSDKRNWPVKQCTWNINSGHNSYFWSTKYLRIDFIDVSDITVSVNFTNWTDYTVKSLLVFIVTSIRNSKKRNIILTSSHCYDSRVATHDCVGCLRFLVWMLNWQKGQTVMEVGGRPREVGVTYMSSWLSLLSGH